MILDRLPPLLRRWAFWLCVFTVLVLALLPGKLPLPSTGWDKTNHALAFFVMAVLGRWAYPRGSLALWWGLFAYGGLIELLQAFTPDRSSEWGDWLADCVGLALAWSALWLAARNPHRPS
jgi:VanZ family protein